MIWNPFDSGNTKKCVRTVPNRTVLLSANRAFVLNILNYFVFYLKKCHNTLRQLLVSDVVCEYGEISVFSHHASVFRIGKNPLAPVLFAQSVTISVLSVLIGRSTLRFSATDIGPS